MKPEDALNQAVRVCFGQATTQPVVPPAPVTAVPVPVVPVQQPQLRPRG